MRACAFIVSVKLIASLNQSEHTDSPSLHTHTRFGGKTKKGEGSREEKQKGKEEGKKEEAEE